MNRKRPDIDPSNFAISTELLSDQPNMLAWSNLGYWTHTKDYDNACQQLAELVAEAAHLKAGQHLLELACGHGASLALWLHEYDIRQCTALDIQTDVIKQLRQQLKSNPDYAGYQLVQGSFDLLPPPEAIQPQSYDTVLCIDAAYHARSLREFLQFLQYSVRPGGRVAFCTLHKSANWATSSRWQRGYHQSLLKLARIPMLSLLTENSIQGMLDEYGFEDVQITHLDSSVLSGFNMFVQRRSKELTSEEKLSAAWIKINLAARMCQTLQQYQLLHYSLISARMKPTC